MRKYPKKWMLIWSNNGDGGCYSSAAGAGNSSCSCAILKSSASHAAFRDEDARGWGTGGTGYKLTVDLWWRRRLNMITQPGRYEITGRLGNF